MARNGKVRRAAAAVAGGIGALVLAAALSACASGTGGAEPPAGQETTQGGSTMSNEAVIGTWKSDERGEPTLEFDDSGRVTGTDGCNRIAADYSVDGDRVLVEKHASTRMACQGVDDWLRAVREAVVDGDSLQIFNGKGERIGTLERSA